MSRAAHEADSALDGGVPCALLVVGCGNLLRGDDGVGPILVRHLWDGGVPPDVRLVDGGTAGMDVAFQMRGARRVVIVDACTTEDAPPGTVYRLPGPAVEDLPPLSGLHTHSFRWDNALAFARWLLGDDYPEDVTVYLIEAEQFAPGAELSPDVRSAMGRVLTLIRREPAFAQDGVTVEFTAAGYLRIDGPIAHEYFPGDAAVVVPKDDEVWLLPLRGTASGGLLLKQRNAAGDRTLLVREALADDLPVGSRSARWDERQGALRISRGAGR